MENTSRFSRSCTKTEKACVTLLYENFSTRVCKGFYMSPPFESEPSGSKWNVIVYTNDGANYENFIEVRLRRDDYKIEMQTVEVKTSVVDCYGRCMFTETKKIIFTECKGAQVLCITKENAAGNYGFNKLLFLPRDTLILQCEFAIHESIVLNFDTRKDFEDSLKESKAPGLYTSVEYFVYSGLTREVFDFIRRIDNFSVHTCGGLYVCPSYQRDPLDSEWVLIVYVDDNNYRGDFLDIRLKREKSTEHQLVVTVKLSIVDGSGKALISKEKHIYFSDSTKEARVLSVSQKSMSGWFGWSKKLLIPEDALTLHCEIVTYDETSVIFDKKEDFNYNRKTNDGYKWKQLYPYQLTLYFFLLALIVGLVAYFVTPVILPILLPICCDLMAKIIVGCGIYYVTRYAIIPTIKKFSKYIYTSIKIFFLSLFILFSVKFLLENFKQGVMNHE